MQIMERGKLVHFGAGNIGRSFIGQLFSRAGFEVVFIDVNKELINLLNERRQYKVIIKSNKIPDQIILVNNVRAVDGIEVERVGEENATASYLSTSVGKDILHRILPSIAKGLILRREKSGSSPLDIIIAENIRNSPDLIREQMRKLLPEDFDFNGSVGLVETSIGKMVPIMKTSDLKADTLQVFAEAYNTLIVDKKGFINEVPELPGIIAVNNIQAYVDRKSFIHNQGHAASAYLGYQNDPSSRDIWEALEIPGIKSAVYQAMNEAALSLIADWASAIPGNDKCGEISPQRQP